MVSCRHLPLSQTSNDEALALEPTLWVQRLVMILLNELLLLTGLRDTCKAFCFQSAARLQAHQIDPP